VYIASPQRQSGASPKAQGGKRGSKRKHVPARDFTKKVKLFSANPAPERWAFDEPEKRILGFRCPNVREEITDVVVIFLFPRYKNPSSPTFDADGRKCRSSLEVLGTHHSGPSFCISSVWGVGRVQSCAVSLITKRTNQSVLAANSSCKPLPIRDPLTPLPNRAIQSDVIVA